MIKTVSAFIASLTATAGYAYYQFGHVMAHANPTPNGPVYFALFCVIDGVLLGVLMDKIQARKRRHR